MHRCVTRRQSARAFATIVGILVASAVMAGCGGGSEQLKGMAAPDVRGGKGVFLPAYGEEGERREMELRASSGKLLLLYFGYLRCPDVCPTTMSALGAAVRSLPPELAKRLEVAMVTADPKRDSGEDIVGYLNHFFRDLPIHGLRTTNNKRLVRAEDAFGAASEIDPHKPGEDYTVSHSAFLYAIDHNGKVLVMWPFGALSEDIKSDIEVLLEKQN